MACHGLGRDVVKYNQSCNMFHLQFKCGGESRSHFPHIL